MENRQSKKNEREGKLKILKKVKENGNYECSLYGFDSINNYIIFCINFL